MWTKKNSSFKDKFFRKKVISPIKTIAPLGINERLSFNQLMYSFVRVLFVTLFTLVSMPLLSAYNPRSN